MTATASRTAQDARYPVLRVEIPLLPPSVNHAYVTRRGGGRALTREAQVFLRLFGVTAQATAASAGWSLPDGPLALTLRLTFPSHQRRDLDNCIKLAQDALADALGFDDRRIVELHAYAAYERRVARTVAEIGGVE